MSDDQQPPFSHNVTPIRPATKPASKAADTPTVDSDTPRQSRSPSGGRLCGAKKRQSEGHCARPSGWGTDHLGSGRCKLHGGSTRSGKMAAGEEAAERQLVAAERALRELGSVNSHATPVDNPLAALAELAGEAIRWKDIAAAFVAHLRDIRYQATSTDEEGNVKGMTEQIRGEVIVFERALARCESILVAIARLNIDERLVRIDEILADRLMSAFDAGMDVLKVSDADRERAEAEVGRRVRKLIAS
jgi:hypothetical protein